MASVDQHCDTQDELEEDKLKHKEVQMSSSSHTGVSVDLNTQTGATVNAPVLAGNTITSVTINMNPAGNEPQKSTETAEEHTEEQEEVKVFTLFTGNANALHKIQKNFIGTLRNQRLNLRVVGTVEESDVILIFCPIVSRVGTDIDAALKIFKDNTGSKPTALVVLHRTFDPEKTVPDSSRCVNRTDILTVDFLFHEDTGLLKCQKNSDATEKAVNWLLQQDESESELVKAKRQKIEIYKPKGLKVFSILAGKTNNCDQEFIAILRSQIESYSEVCTVDESDIILLFCPIVSRTKSDIEAALNKLKGCADSEQALNKKSTVLVVLHRTFDPEKTVPDSSRCVNRTDILTVDFLFHEDTGLLKCQKNADATEKAVNWLLQQWRKADAKSSPHQNPVQKQDQVKSHKSKQMEQVKVDEEKVDEEKADQEKPEKEKVDEEKADQEKPDQEKVDEEKADQEKVDEEKADQEKPDQDKVDQVKTDQEKVDEEKADQEKPDQEKVDEEKADQEKPDQEKVDEEKPDQEKVDEEKADQEKPDQKKVDEEKTEQEKPDQEKVDQVKTDQEKTDQVKVDQVKTDQVKMDQEKPDQEKVDEEKADQEKPDQEKVDQVKPDQENADQVKV